ncbi:hypothetical protein NK8_13060 [Caballeronia sp. NK8]|uniref:hypothetical protein n=1 Tax=Caballeronia sp. NK8 TaxID=140098 RepID=UPI001BB7A838|nr:hypothetical protein [Caballeronia sp. NK8]BCQ23181.1 hypothetical protein NK8_13060 [Caballeronia sp. NK8]
MLRFIIAAVAIVTSSSAFAEGYTATAKLSDGKTLLITEHSKDCGGKKGAALLDQGMMDRDHTCDVSWNDETLTARFGVHEVSMPIGAFSVLSYPSVSVPRP